MKKPVIPSLFVLVLAAIAIGVLALTSGGGNTGHSVGLSGVATQRHKTEEAHLPPLSPASPTTTATAVATTTTVTISKAVTSETSQAKTVPTITTVPVVAKTVAPTTSVTTTTTSPQSGSNVIVQTATTGVMSAPDKTECLAGPSQECVLVSVIHSVVNGAEGPFIAITDANGTVIGSFVAGEQTTFCLIHWWSKSSGTVASSSDCSQGPFQDAQTTFDFTYSSPS